MKNTREQILERIDLYESIKNAVLELSPKILSDSKARTGTIDLTIDEIRLFVTMAWLRWDVRNGSECRKARQIMRSAFEAVSTEQNVVAESPRIEEDQIKTKDLEKLGKVLISISEDSLKKITTDSLNTLDAVRKTEKAFPILRGMKAYSFLESIGHEIAIPDQARQRWFQRMGILDKDLKANDRREQTVQIMEEFAHQTGVSLSEFSTVLGAFCGALGEEHRQAAFCLKNPKCPECTIRERCPTWKYARTELKREHQSLQSKLRKTERPREKLEEKGARHLSEEELIAIILRTGSGKLNTLELAQSILKEADTLGRLTQMTVAELSKFHGLGRVKAITLLAAFELASRINTEKSTMIRPQFDSSRKIFNYFQNRYSHVQKEEFITLILNTKLELIREVTTSVGTLNQSLVHPREVFREAIRESAYAVAFAHNHPTGDCKPSRSDHNITNKLVEAGKILQIEVIDHIILGHQRYYSFRDEGVIP